jgi:hypothetical protein
MILDHHLGKRFGVSIRIGHDELTGLNFQHVALRDLIDEISG